MVRKILLTVIAFLLFTSVSLSNPYLIAEPMDNATEWYIVKINDESEITVATTSLIDWILFHSIHELIEGENKIVVQCADRFGESEKVEFSIIMTIMSSFTRYEIQPDPNNQDPEYLAKFTDNLTVDVSDGDVTEPPPNDDGGGGGGGGGGCFITTAIN